MDTSKEYILMCSKADEIQTLRSWSILTESYNLQPNDFYFGYHPEVGYDDVIYESLPTFRERNIKYWLPRQDQLQDLVSYLYDDNLNLILQFKQLFLDPNDYDEKILQKYLSYSMEQLWLEFVMKEKHNKIWDNERLEWIKQDI